MAGRFTLVDPCRRHASQGSSDEASLGVFDCVGDVSAASAMVVIRRVLHSDAPITMSRISRSPDCKS